MTMSETGHVAYLSRTEFRFEFRFNLILITLAQTNTAVTDVGTFPGIIAFHEIIETGAALDGCLTDQCILRELPLGCWRI